MRVSSVSRWSLGAIVVAAAFAGAGCQSQSVSTNTAMLTAPACPEVVAPVVPSTANAVPATMASTEPAVKVTQSDVINWAARGVGDAEIVDRIDRSRATFRLSAGEEMRLRDAGVSDQVVMAMKASVWN